MFRRNQSGPRDLSRYWATLISGAPPTDIDRIATQLSGETLSIATAMRAMRDDFRPDPAFVDGLENRLTGLHLTTPAPTSPLPATQLSHTGPAAPWIGTSTR